MYLARPFSILLFVLFVIIIFSCQSQGDDNSNQDFSISEYKPGEVIFNMACKSDTTLTYTFYKPVSVDKNKSLPLIIFFDPHGDGALPVLKYKAIADKFGFVVAGSNCIENGLSPDRSLYIANAMLSDVGTRCNVKFNDVTACGFSGGARVAEMFSKSGKISSIVLNSAATPGFVYDDKVTVLGIAGTSDMNYSEIAALDDILINSETHGSCLFFDGKHEWAPLRSLFLALCFIEFKLMKNDVIQKNEHMIKSFKDSLYEQLTATSSLAQKVRLLSFSVKALDNIGDVSQYRNELNKISESNAYKSELDIIKRLQEKENLLRNEYAKAVIEKDISWWKTEIEKLHAKIAKTDNENERAMFGRVRSFISLACFSYVNRALRSNDINAAKHLNLIYEIVDRDNPDVYYFNACINAVSGMADGIYLSLNKAIELGFTDAQKIRNEPVFSPYISKTEFLKIFEKLETK